MKRLITAVLLLISCQTVMAQSQPGIFEEEWRYKLKVSLFGLTTDSAGAAVLSSWASGQERILTFWGQGSAYGKKVDNSAAVVIDSLGRIEKIVHCFSDAKVEVWQVDHVSQNVYHLVGDHWLDTLTLDYQPLDALSAIYYLRGFPLAVGQPISLTIIGHGATTASAWKSAVVEVKAKERKQLLGQTIECWKLVVTLDRRDNLFLGNKVTLWVTADEALIPVAVKTSIKFLHLFPLLTVTAELVSQKGGP